MWYVLQVFAGTETKICQQCQEWIVKEDENVFILLTERMTKIQGKWSLVTGKLFPGYVFVETEKIQDFYIRMKNAGGFAKILKTGEELTPLYPEEEKYLQMLGGDEHIVRYSQGYVQGEKMVITSGALKECCGKVKKILRHKRLLVLEIPLLGREMEVTVGLGIVSKEENNGRVQIIENLE